MSVFPVFEGLFPFLDKMSGCQGWGCRLAILEKCIFRYFFREDPGPSIRPNLAVTSKQEVADNQRKQPLLQAKDKHEQKSKVSTRHESHKHRSEEYRRKTLASSHEPTTKGVDPHIRRKRQQDSSVK